MKGGGREGGERGGVLREHIRIELHVHVAHVLSFPPDDDDHHDQEQCKNHQNSNDDGCYLTWGQRDMYSTSHKL